MSPLQSNPDARRFGLLQLDTAVGSPREQFEAWWRLVWLAEDCPDEGVRAEIEAFVARCDANCDASRDAETPIDIEDSGSVSQSHSLTTPIYREREPALASEPDILTSFRTSLNRSVLEERVSVGCLIYLCLLTRHLRGPLDRIVSIVIKGPSAGGKSWLTTNVLKFVERNRAYLALTGMSPTALVYDERPCRHKFLYVDESTTLNEEAEGMLRVLLSEGRVSRDVTIKNQKTGRFQVQHVEREGPTGLISTTTRIAMNPENETRYLSVTVSDTLDTIQATTAEWSAAAAGLRDVTVDYDPWHKLDRWLEEGDRDVVVPFAPAVSSLVKGDLELALRFKRDWIATLSLIKAHALLHRVTRDRDAAGRIVATLADYEAVYPLVEPILATSSGVSVDRKVREIVEAVGRLLDTTHAQGDPPGVPLHTLGKELGLSRASVYRRWHAAGDLLVNVEWRPKQPARLALGVPLEEDRAVLPSPEAVSAYIGGGETVRFCDSPEKADSGGGFAYHEPCDPSPAPWDADDDTEEFVSF